MKLRRGLYGEQNGGERGIQNPGIEVQTLLRVFAKADFMHDFGEGIDARDKYTQDDMQRFIEISQRFGLSKMKALIAGFSDVLGKNPFLLHKASVPKNIYPTEGDDKDYIHEPEVMSAIGLNYGALKNEIRAYKTGKTLLEYLETPYTKDDITLTVGGNLLHYEVTAVPLKIESGTPNIATLFHNATRKQKSSFALIVDAAGGLSLTALRNSGLSPVTAPPGGKPFEFFLIENIENDSDSATKIKNLDKDTGDGTNVTVSFLRDVPDTVVYPAFMKDKTVEQGENLYGNARLVLSRSLEETEADFLYSDTESYHIENVSQNANVKNASLNMLAAGLAGRGREMFMYPYIKRVGDWCQALSLLDVSREYDILKANRLLENKRTTLHTLFEGGTDVALVTLDRILLAYALSLGLTVYFTTGSDISSLLYFRNKDVDMSEASITAGVQELSARLDALGEMPPFDFTPIVAIMDALPSEQDDIVYIRKLRSFLSNFSMMRFDFDSLRARIEEVTQQAITLQSEPDLAVRNKALYSVYTELLSLKTKYTTDIAHDTRLMSSIDAGTYPDYVFDKPVFETLKLARPSRAAIGKIKLILSKKMYNDVEQCMLIEHPDLPAGKLASLFRGPISTGTDIFDGFKPIQILLGRDIQTGGGSLIDALKQFQVFPVEGARYKATIESQTVDQLNVLEDSTPLVLVKGSYYRDEKSNPYTVVDQYIITKEDIFTFDALFPSLEGADEDSVKFIVLRYLLLYADMMMAQYEALISNDEVTSTGESEVNFLEHQRLHVEANWMRDLVASMGSNLIEAQKTASQHRINIGKLDNETIRTYTLSGAPGYRIRNNEFSRTFEILKTIQQTIVRLYTQTSGVTRRRSEDDSRPATRRRTAGRRRNRTRREKVEHLFTR